MADKMKKVVSAASRRPDLGPANTASLLAVMSGLPAPLSLWKYQGANMPQRSVKPGSVRLAAIQLKSWMLTSIEPVGADIKRTAHTMGLQTSGIIRLPTSIKRWTVNRSPFVHAMSKTQYERREYNRLIEIFGEGTQSYDATNTLHFLRYLEHVLLPAHGGTSAWINLYSDEVVLPAAKPAPVKLRRAPIEFAGVVPAAAAALLDPPISSPDEGAADAAATEKAEASPIPDEGAADSVATAEAEVAEIEGAPASASIEESTEESAPGGGEEGGADGRGAARE